MSSAITILLDTPKAFSITGEAYDPDGFETEVAEQLVSASSFARRRGAGGCTGVKDHVVVFADIVTNKH